MRSDYIGDVKAPKPRSSSTVSGSPWPQRQPAPEGAACVSTACPARNPSAVQPSLPYFPRRLALGPELFQHRLVAQRIHRVPKTAMLKGHHLSHRREPDIGELSQLLSSPSIRSRQRGDRTKKPPLISPPSPRGFSMKRRDGRALGTRARHSGPVAAPPRPLRASHD